MDLFLNPAYMIAGAALISAPIIIHLINRMRFKRVRWAAMEFLLKSQKRNRRRLIIEQLILLALRCALVALAGFLVARYIGGLIERPKDVDHFVVLDDTLSTKDRWREEGEDRTAFDVGKKKVLEIAKEALKADSPQYLHLVTLSNLDNEVKLNDNGRLNAQSVRDLETKLNDLQPSRLHVRPADGVKWAREQVTDPNHQRMLHFVSDLRESDWTGPEVENLNKELDGFTGAGGKVLLFDVAHLYRSERQPIALHHDNIAISDLRPETRFTAEGMPVLFTATIRNYTPAKKNVFFNVKVDGQVRFEATQPVDINPGENRHTFLLSFNKRGYNMVSAALQDKDQSGVPDDDTRVAVIKVEPQVPILMIDGGEDQPNSRKDSFYLQKLFVDAAKGYQIVYKTKEELETLELTPDRFPCAYLLNVPSLSEKAAKRLEGYVEQGGRVAVFVGDRVQAAVYNKLLYANGNGILPAPLEPKPAERVDPETKFKRMFEGQFQIYLRDDTNPIFKEVADPKIKESFKFLSIDQYWPTQPRFRWNADPSKVHELVTLPNRKDMNSYTSEAGGPGDLQKQVQALVDEPKFEKFRPALKRHADGIRKALGETELYALANALDAFLTDRGDPRDPNSKDRPDLKLFWDMPENTKLHDDVVRLRDTVTYGDPLVVSKSFGKGETVVFLTTAGLAWNDWGGRSMASPTYPIVMLSLQKYLTSAGDESSRTLGMPLEIALDADSYDGRAKVSFQRAPGEEKEGAAPAPGAPDDSVARELETVTGKEGEGKQLRFSFAKTREPGVYYVSVKGKMKANETKEPQPYDEAFVYNVDTEAEGNLKRAARDMLERGGSAAQARGQVALITPDMRLTEILAPKRKDMSEAPWLYLVILIILIVEQALAVHLSFHLKGNEAQLPPGVAGEARTAVPVASDAA